MWAPPLEWRASSPPPPRYLGLRHRCLNGTKNRLAGCVDVDLPLLRTLENASLLTLGDSTAYRTVVHVCSAVSREKLRSFVGVPKFNRSSPYFVRAFKDVHHKYDHVGCRLLGGDEAGRALRQGWGGRARGRRSGAAPRDLCAPRR